jgi:hypothetical protein
LFTTSHWSTLASAQLLALPCI